MKDMRKTKAQLVAELEQLRATARQGTGDDRRSRPDRQLLIGLVDQMLEPTVFIDFDGTLLHGNRLAAEVLALADAGAIAGRSIAEFMHPDSLARAAADLQAVKEASAPFSAHYTLQIEGRHVEIESHGTRIDLAEGPVDLVSFRDVTRRRAAEERDRANELFLKSVLDHSSTVIYIKDLTGRYLLINKRYEELFGIRNAEIAGQTDYDIFPADAAARFQAVDRRALAAAGPIEAEEIVPQADGPHTYLSVKFPMYDEGGAPFAIGGISTDISDRKQAEAAMAIHHDELEARVAERTRELTAVNRKLHEEIADREFAEDALAESEAKYRALFENSVVGQFRVAVGGKMLDANRAMAEMFGWDDLEPFVRECEMAALWVDPDDRARMHRIMQERGELDSFEARFYRKDGTAFPVRVSSKMYPEYGYQEGIVIDISEEQAALEALTESEKKFRALAESTTAQITIIQDDRYVYANQAFLDYHGLDADDLALISPEELGIGMMSPEAIAQARQVWEAAMTRGDSSFSVEFPDVDGNWFQTNVTMIALDGKPSFIGLTFDISELKRAQEELKENEERYRTIFDTAGTVMISFGDDAVITMANEEWTELSGYSKEETIGKLTWMQFFTEEALVKMRQYHVQRAVDPSAVPSAYEAQFVDRAGRIHDGIVNIQLVPGTTQRVASFQDMTELKRAQHEMYRADKMAALGQIIAGVAHEINNPNNFIYFNLPILRRYIEAIAPLLEQRLAEEPDLAILGLPYRAFLEDVFKLLENMEHGSKRITAIVSDLKNYVRSDEDRDLQDEQIAAIVDRVMTLVGKQVRKMVKRFGVEVDADLPAIRMNTGKIEQVLINLLINAGQAACREDSWVELSVRRAAGPEPAVEITIADNGCGIPAENMEQIFEPFFTSKARELGTGLGLSISQRIVAEHGGTISVESNPGEGARFLVRLPAAPTA